MKVTQKIFLGIGLLLVTLAFIILKPNVSPSIQKVITSNTNPLSIESLRNGSYPGSDIKIEETLTPEKTYNRYIASYMSDGFKIYTLLLVPNMEKPKSGFPVIILNHGYIIPQKYTPDGNYVAYTDAFARAGYIVFKPSYRGHGKSEGAPTSAYFAPDYVIDDLNAIASIKKYKDADGERIGVWGHSMGGNITLKDLVISKDIKAAVIWGGVVAPINDIINNWQGRVSYKPDPLDLQLRNQNRDFLLTNYGTPSRNQTFWNSIDPNNYLQDIIVPVQIDVGLSDSQVPPDFSTGLYTRLKSLDKTVEYFEYPGSNHDINQSFSMAMGRTISFFDKYLK
jgi:dipeptidyl aminopeptidase/acylaminoacyl peptidase